jgi:hypothetical protein
MLLFSTYNSIDKARASIWSNKVEMNLRQAVNSILLPALMLIGLGTVLGDATSENRALDYADAAAQNADLSQQLMDFRR